MDDLHPLAESPRYLLAHAFEEVLLVEKATGVRTSLGDHYGDPTCGLIGPAEDWFLTGGEGVLYFDIRRGLRSFLRPEVGESLVLYRPQPEGPLVEPAVAAPPRRPTHFVRAVRLAGPRQARILVDPWSAEAATWELDVDTLALRKVATGPSLVGQPYREDIDF